MRTPAVASMACLLVPSLALTCELAERPQLVGACVVLANPDRVRVVDCTAEAARYGVRAGQQLRTAAALCPQLVTLEERPAHVARTAEALVEALLTVAPLVEEAAPGTVYASLHGLDSLYPGPGAIERAILAAAPSTLHARLGIADARFTALAAAYSAAPGESLRVDPEDAASFLGSKPAAWLPLDGETIEQLHRFGIETIADFAVLAAHAVEAQFGTPGRNAWLAARGLDPTPLRPRPYAPERVIEHAESEPPLVSREAVTLTLEQMLIRALRHPRAQGRFIRSIRLRATTEDDRLWERTQVLREPNGDRARLWHTIRPLLEYAQYLGPIAHLELELDGLTAESARQPSLLDAERVRCREQMDEMVRHLKLRYGLSPMARVVEVESWSRIPERRWALMDYDP